MSKIINNPEIPPALPWRVASLLLLRNWGRYTKHWTWCRFSILRISGERRKWRKGKLCLQNTLEYFCDFITLQRLILRNSHSSLWTSCQSIILSIKIALSIFLTWNMTSLSWELRNRVNIWSGKYISSVHRRKWFWNKKIPVECRLF